MPSLMGANVSLIQPHCKMPSRNARARTPAYHSHTRIHARSTPLPPSTHKDTYMVGTQMVGSEGLQPTRAKLAASRRPAPWNTQNSVLKPIRQASRSEPSVGFCTSIFYRPKHIHPCVRTRAAKFPHASPGGSTHPHKSSPTPHILQVSRIPHKGNKTRLAPR